MTFFEFLKALFLGIVEGITEWLPVSSTGHMILVDEFIKLKVSPAFLEMFLVVIQLGAIMAVVLLYFKKLFPIEKTNAGFKLKNDTLVMWLKILVSCIPAAVVGLLFDDKLNELFYNYKTVAVSLIVFGIIFIIVENFNKKKEYRINSIAEITYTTAALIGIFQLIAAIFPGVSRSGATIVGALIIGVARGVAAEYTFFLAVPVMFGASLLKIMKFIVEPEAQIGGAEIGILITGLISAFAVSVFAIKFLMGYIKKHDFKVFGWYRIILGAVVIIYFAIKGALI